MSKKIFTIVSILVLAAMILAACAPAATEAPPEVTEAPVATEVMTEAPEVTEAPTEAPEVTEPPVAAFECTDAIGCVDIAPGDPIHLAWALTVSGATAPLGEDSKGAIEIAIDDRGGTLLDHPIQLTGEDTLCNAEGGQAAGTKISADSTVIGVVGTNCSSEARAAMPLIANAGMVMISPSNTNPDLTDPTHPDHYPGYFRTAHNDLFQGRVAAEFAFNELGMTKAATIHDGSPYAESLQRVFAEVFVELGGEITAQEAVNVGDTDMKPVLTTIANGGPEIIYFPIFEPEGDLIAAQAKEVSGLETTILMGADGLFADTFPEATGDAAAGMYLSGPYVDPTNPAYAEFLGKWEAKFGGVPPSGFHSHAYDATNMLMDAIEAVAVVDADGTVHIGRQALRDAMYATANFDGLTGNLTCDENGDCATGEALAIFILSEAEVGGNWPPAVYWRPGQ
ncbi:MAG TPA: branched-chain amino acid ABC transporter substrate-binding protein [Anaerolineales bacterium]|nr:branched-chain amino acid ABC transporter substrate-binding protein [Anaerolineales bacterium]